jgi:hypothetical protein
MAHSEERRAEQRSTLTVTMEYTFLRPYDGEPVKASGSGVTTNLSRRGLCFYTYHHLGEGQEVKVYSHQIARSPLLAEVRWCERISTTLFKVGLSFN